MPKTALILGVSGQDGAYLSRFLLDGGYTVHGTSHDAAQTFPRLHALGIRHRIGTHTAATTDADALRTLISALRPDEIYNLSGLSSVAQSFAEPAVAHASITVAHQTLLDVARVTLPSTRVYHSASSECFGDLAMHSAATEATPFAPLSPYAEAKAAAHAATADSRSRGLFTCSGIVFNHESPLRGEMFVTKKIISGAAAIAAGRTTEKLHLGDLSASRDWGYAPEYVEAMWLALQHAEPRDYVIATGESHTVEELAIAAFAAFDLDHREHVVTDASLIRSAELRYSRGDASRARDVLGWEAKTKFGVLVKRLADAERQRPVPASDDETARNMSWKSSHTDQSHMYIRS